MYLHKLKLTVYVCRDVAALLDRYDKYKFDRIHYVVSIIQSASAVQESLNLRAVPEKNYGGLWWHFYFTPTTHEI